MTDLQKHYISVERELGRTEGQTEEIIGGLGQYKKIRKNSEKRGKG